MIVLGIDPGPMQSAYLAWDDSHKCVGINGIVHSLDVLDVISSVSADVVACEHIEAMGMAVGKDVFETAYWIGEYRAASRMANIPFVRVYRHEVKMTLCQNVRAKDSNIRQALIDMLGVQMVKVEVPAGPRSQKRKFKNIPGPTYGIHDDLWSALAVAITYCKIRPCEI